MKKKDETFTQEEYQELSELINKSILLCDNEADLLKLACIMVEESIMIFDRLLGVEGRKELFRDYE